MAKRKSAPRTPSGQLSRSASALAHAERVSFEEGPTQTVLKARRRQVMPITADYIQRDAKPVTKQQAASMKLDQRGSVLGNLCADGAITPQELAAGLDYCERYNAYASANGLPKPTPSGPAYGAIRGGMNRPERIKATIAATAAHKADQDILRRCSAGVMPAMRRACVVDELAPTYQIKEGLAALVRSGR